MFTFENCPFPLKKPTDISNDKREEKRAVGKRWFSNGKQVFVGDFFFFFDAEIMSVKFWDFQKSSDYILAYQRSIVHKVFLKVPEFFHTKKENEAINMNKKKILYA